MSTAAPLSYTLQQIADRWGCSHSTVLSHVYAGTLRAIDISTNPERRSRYIIPSDALEEFEAARDVSKIGAHLVPPPKRNRVRVRPGEVIEFFT